MIDATPRPDWQTAPPASSPAPQVQTYSALLTVYDREPGLFLAHLRSLHRSLGPDDQIVIVNDRSHMDYSWAKGFLEAAGRAFEWIDMPEYEAFTVDGGFKNPAAAFNEGLSRCTGDGLFILSSDVLLTPKAVERAKSFRLDEMCWVPMVIDVESGNQYCGPLRLFPAPWFLACSTAKAKECGGWDEGYLDGMCYEDNDFIGRLTMATGRFIGDWSVCVYHLSHDQPAYRVDDPEIKAANERNRLRTKQKWSGMPFGGAEETPFDIIRKPYLTGDVVHEIRWWGTLKEDTVAGTKSRFVPVPA